jgi:glutaredoxin
MNRTLDIATSFAASLARVAAGKSVGRLGRRPDEPLALYEFESCPYCRKAREALTVLDLEAMIYPCPKGGPGYRDVSVMMASALRPASGRFYSPSRAPATPLELYSYEASPFCRIVRETLTCLEIPYLLHNVGRGSPRREAFVERSGKMMVPYLVDPNTGVAMFESAEISRYLIDTYGETA